MSEATRTRPTPKARRTRRHLLDTSLRLFREKGFDRTSMRDIAAASGLSLGATYYHFRTKDELVFDFYAQTHEEAIVRNAETVERTSRFTERFADIVRFKLEQLAPFRAFIAILARNAVDPTNPLSPFSPQTAALRDGAIEIIEAAVEGSDLEVHPELAPHLSRLLWLIQMGIVFLWIHDPSRGQARTQRVVERGVGLVVTLMRVTAAPIPGMTPIIRSVVELLADLEVWRTDEAAA